jgi:hypothetical protein
MQRTGTSRRKARLAVAALGVGDTTLPIDACEFEGRTDHGLRTLFIDEFPRWELDRRGIGSRTVKDSRAPATSLMRYALVCGRIPVKQVSSDDKSRCRRARNQVVFAP